MERGLARLGAWCARRARWVLLAWVLAAAGFLGSAVVFGMPTTNDVRLPGSDAQRAHDLLEAEFGPQKLSDTVQLVLYAHDGRLTDPLDKASVEAALDRLERMPVVKSVKTPYRMGGLSENLQVGMVVVKVHSDDRKKTADMIPQLEEAAAPAARAGIEVVPAGSLDPAEQGVETGPAEIVGLIAAGLILVVAFGTLVAAGLPIVTALICLAAGIAVIGLLGHLTDIPGNAPVMATMIGLGVGIDYSLFLLSRHRQLLAGGLPVPEAVSRTVATAGGAVVFAGGTVVIALSGLMLAGLPMLATIAWTTGLIVVFAVLAAITLVPALLALLGHRINSLPLPFLGRRRKDGRAEGWVALARRVARRPWLVLGGTLALLALLTVPAFSLTVGQLDDGFAKKGTESRRSYELMSTALGPGVSGPLFVAGEITGTPAESSDDPRVKDLTKRLADVPGVAHVQPVEVSGAGSTVSVQVIPDTAPSDPATEDVIDRVRNLPLNGMKLHVGGEVAAEADLGDHIRDRTPLVVGVVIGMSMLLLLLAFRAPVVAVKAALMNLVSLGAAFGALAMVFSWGLGSGLVGIDRPLSQPEWIAGQPFQVPVEAIVPLMMFAVLFGLSMDYEVFLLSAIRQSYDRTRDNRASVAEGLGSTGRVVTSAALIMVSVFLAFVQHPDTMVKMIGIGMATAIAVDATVIRGFLVPASMILLGRANWWIPRWLDRVLPPLSIAHHVDEPAASGTKAAPPAERESVLT